MRINRTVVVFLLATVLSAISWTEDITIEKSGQTYILHPDHTWELKTGSQFSAPILILKKDISQTTQALDPESAFTFNYNPDIWTTTKNLNEEALFSFASKNKLSFGLIIVDRFGVPLELMEEALVINAQSIDPNARIVETIPCTVNGSIGELVTYKAKSGKIDLTFLSFICTKEKGSIQVTFFTFAFAFDKAKESFLTAISGIEF